MADSSQRAVYVSLFGLILSLIFFLSSLVLGALLASPTLYVFSWQVLSTFLIWLVLLIQFYHRYRAEQEKLDLAELKRAREKQTIFEGTDERLELFAVAQKRLEWVEKWFLPISGVLIAIGQIIMGILLIRFISGPAKDFTLRSPLLGAAFLVLLSFFSFLISRYATGLSSAMIWRPLRAGGSSLLATSILGFAAAVSLAFAQYKYQFGLIFLNWFIPILLIVLGVETILTAVFDLYRPRLAGQYSRACFDSRLLGLINEPGGILHTVASTLDYQFGFKVSQTWFYQLLEKAIVPLLLFLLLVIYLFSCVVIVQPGEGAVIEHFGSAAPEDGGRQVGPGWCWKWPWPFERAYVYPMEKVRMLHVGYIPAPEDAARPILWGQKHYKEEYKLLVAVETQRQTGQTEKGAAPVSYIIVDVPVHYKIRDLHRYLYQHENSEEMLESLCYRELARFAASAKIEPDESLANPERQKSLLGAGQEMGCRVLQQRMQEAADAAQLGVEIVFVGMVGVHPPPEVAPNYEEVVAAVQKQQATILTAQAEHNKVLTGLAGSIEKANDLYSLVRQISKASQAQNAALAQSLMEKLEKMVHQAQGKLFLTIRQAEAYAFERVARAQGEGLRFAGQVKANQAGGELFQRFRRLQILEESLPSIRKYVVSVGQEDQEIYILDLEEKMATGLLEMNLDSVIKQ
ncbi:MAG TPA: SPFH domain-containing protein [Anaerohalosphaeraceae bacterium]|nr:SPFH domain-containing protein [Anaerohalosphaeraceae bacterium]HQG06475.1 SPFH domain-containing protein [Anaerohalosphaeraceae bacterium]HQI07914.1 SPFH domain-containing protein [Anaerohalosphaeraceae bacterium]HQJ68186.1 SPFH domain-containing protein [Anaerohalosphaeraceae bacterium]